MLKSLSRRRRGCLAAKKHRKDRGRDLGGFERGSEFYGDVIPFFVILNSRTKFSILLHVIMMNLSNLGFSYRSLALCAFGVNNRPTPFFGAR